VMSVRVLLAEDQAMVRGALSALLSMEDDIEIVAEAARGDEVLPAALDALPDVALLDIEMPGGDGLEAAARFKVELVAPATLQPEFFNALWWKHRRGELSQDEVRLSWNRLLEDEPASLYAPEDLMPRAAGIVFDSGAIIYDALFLALAESTETLTVTADDKLLRALEGTDYVGLALPLSAVGDLLG
jgi:two-component system response regulator DesR